MKIFLSTAFFLVCFSCKLLGQATEEQLSQIRNELQRETSDSGRLNLIALLAFGYRFSNIDSSLLYNDQAIELARKMNLPRAEANLKSLKGATLLEMGRLPESLQYQYEALAMNDRLKDDSLAGRIYNRIGNTYMELGDYRKANENYFISWKYLEKAKDSFYFNEISNIGNIYELMRMPDSAKYYADIVWKVFEKTDKLNPYVVSSEVMYRTGNVYRLLGDTAQAEKFYRLAIDEAYKENDIRNLTMSNLLLSRLYRDRGITDSSLKYAYAALKSGKIVQFRKGVFEVSQLLSDHYKSTGQQDSALFYLEQANVERDVLFGVKRFQEIQRILFDEQEKQRVEGIKAAASKNRQRQLFLGAALGVILVVAGILYRNNKQKQQANQVLNKTVADLKTTQAQLVHSEKMASLGELTAGIAHEIQNPLNFVNNFSEVNRELTEEMEEEIAAQNWENVKKLAILIRDNQERITQHGKRADSIVKGMLQHSRSSSGQKEPTDINVLADEYLRLSYHGLRAKDKTFNADINTDLDPAVGKVNVVPQDVGRVIMNLFTNAFYAVSERKASQPGFKPAVHLSTKKLNGKVEIRVSDNGNGIPEEVRNKIFQPFFTTKPTGKGTGLGLSLSYDIIKAHQGELKVETKTGEGTAFTIELPNK